MTKIFLSGFVFPVTPEEIYVESAQGNVKYNTIGVGDVLFIGRSELIRVSFEGFFPYAKTPYTVEGASVFGINCVERIQTLRASREPLRLTVSGGLKLAINCAVDNFIYRAARGRDTYYSISLTEYRGVV